MSRGNQATLSNGESGLSFRTALNNMFSDLYGPSTALQPTVWIDPNRIDSYTADGSIQFPYKTLGAMCTALVASTLPGLAIFFTGTTSYTESSLVTLPATITGPIVINGNGGTITFNAGFTIPSGLAAPVIFYGLNIIVPPGFSFIQAQTSGSYRNILDTCTVSGAMTIDGYIEARATLFTAGVITIVTSTGAFYPIGCSFTSGGIAASQITSAGALYIVGCRILYSGAQFSVVSTGGSFFIYDSYINNGNSTSTAGCIDIHTNGATSTLPNFINDVQAICGYTTAQTINVGSTTTYIGKVFSNTTATPVWSGSGALPFADLVSTGLAATTGSSLFYNAFNINLIATAATSVTLPTSGYIPSSTAANVLSFTTTGTTTLTLPAITSGYVVATGASNQVLSFTTATGTTTLNVVATGTQTVLTSASAAGSFTPSNPTLTASTTQVMMGLGTTATITPVQTGRVLITMSGQMSNATINDGTTVQLYTGTGTAPANGVAFTGTARGAAQTFTALVAAQKDGFSITWTVTGLTLGTALWIDAALNSVTGGNSTITAVSITAIEF